MEWKKCIDLARSKQQQDQHEEAIQHYNDALVIAQANTCPEQEAFTLAQLADLSLSMAKYLKAEECFQKGLLIAQKTGDEKMECNMCIGLAKAYKNLEKCKKGMIYATKALGIAQRTKDSLCIAQSYDNLAYACVIHCEYENSITYFHKAIDLFLQLKDEDSLAKCYANLSSSYLEHGDYQKALDFQQESLKLCEKLGNKESQANSLYKIGNIHLTLKKNEEAIKFYEKSLSKAKEIKNKSIEASCYLNTGWALICCGNHQGALPKLMEALAIARKLGRRKLQAIALSNIASCYVDMKLYREAMPCLEESLAIAKELDVKDVEAWVCQNLAEVHYANLEFQEAIGNLEKCSEIASSIHNKDRLWKACHRLGKMCRSIAKQSRNQKELPESCMNKSEVYLKKALECYDYLLENLHGHDEFKISIFDRFTDTYKLLTSVLIETHQKQHALLVSDRGRARVLGDCLTSTYGMSQDEGSSSKPLTYTDVESIHSNDAFTLLHYSSLDEQLAVWVSNKDSMTLKETSTEKLTSALDTLFREKAKEHDDTIDHFLVGTVARAYDDMKITEGRTCENRSLDDVTKSDSQQSHTEPVSRDDIGKDLVDPDLHSLEVLYNTLIAPVLSDIQHDEIVIVPDGKMYTVPFAALKDPKTGKYLSETKRIRLVPSIAVLKLLQECTDDHHNQGGVLIVGNPSVGQVKLRGQVEKISDLPYAEMEVNNIKKLLEQVKPKPKITLLTKEQATKTAVLEKMKEGVAVIHIAAHGSPKTGEIALAPITSQGRQGLPQEPDYLLTMKEVQEVGVKALLVVLSCCNSGQGEVRAEGMVGLARAFLAAGVRAVVASLWAIDDEITRNFMEKFYEFLLQGQSASESLYGAMGHVRKYFSEPKYWAPFLLIGHDVTINFGK